MQFCHQEEGETAGLLHARVLALVRSGIREDLVEPIVRDVNLALSLDENNEDSVYRKATVRNEVVSYNILSAQNSSFGWHMVRDIF